MNEEICIACKRKSYNCHDWCLLWLAAKIRNKEEAYDEARSYAIEKAIKLKKKKEHDRRKRR